MSQEGSHRQLLEHRSLSSPSGRFCRWLWPLMMEAEEVTPGHLFMLQTPASLRTLTSHSRWTGEVQREGGRRPGSKCAVPRAPPLFYFLMIPRGESHPVRLSTHWRTRRRALGTQQCHQQQHSSLSTDCFGSPCLQYCDGSDTPVSAFRM